MKKTGRPGFQFRAAALNARKRNWMGQILLARPLSYSVLTGAALLIVAALGALLAWGEFTRKERVEGRIVLQGGVAKMYSPVLGTVTRRLVEEGQQVRRGQALFVISVDRPTAKGETQSAVGEHIASKRESMRAQLALQRQVFAEDQQALRRKLGDLQAQLGNVERETAIQGERLRLAQTSLARFRELSSANFVSPAQVAEREQDRLDQESRLQSLKRSDLSLRADIAAAESALRNAPLQARAKLADIEQGISSLEQESFENEARRAITVLALQDGRATAVLPQVGQSVALNAPLLTIVPAGSAFEAHLYVPSRAIGFMREGARAQLRYEAFPYQKFGQYGGIVQSISRAALPPQELQLAADGADNLYRVTVRLDKQFVTAYGKPLALQDGMQLDADILLETRKLYEWLLEPLYSVTGKM